MSQLIYIGGALGFVAGDRIDQGINRTVRDRMVQLFAEEFQGNGWVRAMSLSDSTARNIDCEAEATKGEPACGVEDLLAMRADWTATGGYGGLAGLAADALAGLEGGFDVRFERRERQW